MAEGVLIIGHGTRDPAGVAEFERLLRGAAAARPELAVEGGFLEFQAPTISEAFERLVARGCEAIRVAPAILFAAGHAQRDIPAEIARAARRNERVRIETRPVLGCHREVLALSARRFDEALDGARSSAGDLLVMVGRGSREASATAEMHEFAKLRGELRRVETTRVAFLAMAEPSVDAALAEAIAERPRRVVVQPHLLFPGELAARLERLVDRWRREAPAIEWRLASVLGAEPEIVRALLGQ